MPKKNTYEELKILMITIWLTSAVLGISGAGISGAEFLLKLLLPYFPRKTRIRVCLFEVPCMFVTLKLNTVLGCYMTELDIYTK